MKQPNMAELREMLDFLENAPEDQEIINMDCNDHCEQMACLAEQVARGADLNQVLPKLQKHMRYWKDCREEFLALVAILRAEIGDSLPPLPSQNDKSS
jgi:hypothetical protein